MYLFEVTLNEATASIRMMTMNYNTSAELQMNGDPYVVEVFRDWLARARGPFGHGLNLKNLFVSDLDFALFSEEVNNENKWFGEARLVEGQRGDWYHLDLPEGAVS